MNNLIRFNPFTEMSRLDPLWEPDEMFNRFMLTAMRPAWPAYEMAEPQIKMDIADTGTEYVVKAEIPGVHKDDIHVAIDGNLVTISAESQYEKETEDASKLLCKERWHGKTMRRFRLDQDVLDDKVEARYADGVLELKLPKKQAVTHKEVAIA